MKRVISSSGAATVTTGMPLLTRAADEEIVKLKARIAELKKKIEEHNKECDDTCKLWRENETCSHRDYDLQCPNCPKDWKIEG